MNLNPKQYEILDAIDNRVGPNLRSPSTINRYLGYPYGFEKNLQAMIDGGVVIENAIHGRFGVRVELAIAVSS